MCRCIILFSLLACVCTLYSPRYCGESGPQGQDFILKHLFVSAYGKIKTSLSPLFQEMSESRQHPSSQPAKLHLKYASNETSLI